MRATLGLALLLCLLSCGDRADTRPAADRPDVLLITIDTLRADALHCYGRQQARTPFIDRLAADGARFKFAFTPRGATLPALTTILTGVSPLAHGVIGNDYALGTQQPTLAEILHAQGYQTGAFLTNQCVTLVERDDHVGRGFDTKVCAKTDDEEHQYLWDENASRLALSWLAEREARPVFLWVHLMDPHGNHFPRMELYRGRLPADAVLDDQAAKMAGYEVRDETPPAEFMEILWDLYDAEIENVDRLVGGLVDAMRRRNPNNAPIIVLTGDHGEELYQHDNFRGHGDSIYDAVLRVPLLLCAPGRVEPGLVPTVFAELQDIVPTVLDMLAVQPSVRLQGESLLPRMTLNLDKELGFGQAFGIWDQQILTVRRPRYRYVWNQNPGGQTFIDEFRYRSRFEFFSQPELLFDAEADPAERNNLMKDGVAALPETAAATRRAMRKQLQDWVGNERHLSFQPTTIVDSRLDAELRQLGYK